MEGVSRVFLPRGYFSLFYLILIEMDGRVEGHALLARSADQRRVTFGRMVKGEARPQKGVRMRLFGGSSVSGERERSNEDVSTKTRSCACMLT